MYEVYLIKEEENLCLFQRVYLLICYFWAYIASLNSGTACLWGDGRRRYVFAVIAFCSVFFFFAMDSLLLVISRDDAVDDVACMFAYE